jgi:hypothetical protein
LNPPQKLRHAAATKMVGYIAVPVLMGLWYCYPRDPIGMLAQVILLFGCMLVASAIFAYALNSLIPKANLDGLAAVIFGILLLGDVAFDPTIAQWQLAAVAILGTIAFTFLFVSGPRP